MGDENSGRKIGTKNREMKNQRMKNRGMKNRGMKNRGMKNRRMKIRKMKIRDENQSPSGLEPKVSEAHTMKRTRLFFSLQTNSKQGLRGLFG